MYIISIKSCLRDVLFSIFIQSQVSLQLLPNIIELDFYDLCIVSLSLIMAGIMAINTNIEDTINII